MIHEGDILPVRPVKAIVSGGTHSAIGLLKNFESSIPIGELLTDSKGIIRATIIDQQDFIAWISLLRYRVQCLFKVLGSVINRDVH